MGLFSSKFKADINSNEVLLQSERVKNKNKWIKRIGFAAITVVWLLGLTALVIGSIASFGVLPTALGALVAIVPGALATMRSIHNLSSHNVETRHERLMTDLLRQDAEAAKERLEATRRWNNTQEALAHARNQFEIQRKYQEARERENQINMQVADAIDAEDQDKLRQIISTNLETLNNTGQINQGELEQVNAETEAILQWSPPEQTPQMQLQ